MSMLQHYHIIDLDDLRRASRQASDYRGPKEVVVPLSGMNDKKGGKDPLKGVPAWVRSDPGVLRNWLSIDWGRRRNSTAKRAAGRLRRSSVARAARLQTPSAAEAEVGACLGDWATSAADVERTGERGRVCGVSHAARRRPSANRTPAGTRTSASAPVP